MKTLAGWIVGVFALGLVVGGLYRGISAEAENPTGIANLPSVDCGPGREVLYEPVADGGTAPLRVRCVAIEPASPRRAAATPVVAAPAAPAPVPVAATPAPTRREAGMNDEAESRSWEKSALIIGSAAGAGAGIGAIAKGGKGAAVGAAVGGVAGTVYDLATRKKKQ